MSTSVCQGCQERDQVIADLLQRVADLEATVRDLRARLQQNSTNSSRPASTDTPDVPRPKPKPPATKKRGAQPGHQPFLRQRLPSERIRQVIIHAPTQCGHCHAALPSDPQPGDPEPSWHQVVDLPPVLADVVEHQGHSRVCPCCQQTTHASIPADIKAQVTGPGLAGLLAYLRSLKVSLRGIEELVESLFGVPLALGTIARLEQEMSAALAAPHAEVLAAVRAAPVKNVDETSWKQGGRLRWLWAAATLTCAAFVIHDKRGRPGFEALLGKNVFGMLISDRWSVYGLIPAERRQVCWAHLKRDFQKWFDYGGKAARVGQTGLNVVKEMFETWHLFRGGGLDREGLLERIGPMESRLKRSLRWGTRHGEAKLRAFCWNLLGLWPALWLFTREPGVEPTNNHAERVLRRGVLWRKCSQGSRSDGGCRFVERMLTAVQTLRLQKRSVLPWLTAALTAHRKGLAAPSLLTTR